MDKNGNKTGGRKKGTTNKVTAETRATINKLLTEYQDSGKMSKDFLSLEPKDRLICAEKLMQYVIPKLQSTAVDITSGQEDITIEQQLITLSQKNTEVGG